VAETVAPVVHGVRRWLVAVAAFAAGSVAAGAGLGWALGWASARAGGGGEHGAWAAAAVVGAYAAREAGFLRLPVPQLRRQVPQRWREVLPLPATAFLYGAGLGAGFITYVPVATLAAVAAAIALADPAAGTVALAAFGAGRAIVLVAATAGLRDWDAAADRLERAGGWLRERGGVLRSANAAALAALAGVLVATGVPATAAAAIRLDLGSQHVADPSPGPGHVLAWDQVSGGVVEGKLRVNGVVHDLPGKTPDVDGTRVVVDTGSELQIIDTGTLGVMRTLQLKGTEPALFGHWLVYRRVTNRRRLILLNLGTNHSRVIASVKMRSDLGEPDISGRRIVYSVTGRGKSSIRIYRLDQGVTKRVLQTPIWSYSHASVGADTIVYVRQGSSGAAVWRLDLPTNRSRRVFRVPHGTGQALWSTATTGTATYFTLYTKTESHIWHA
jgi:cytochrome c biogenesis protein CcdA